MRYNGEMESLVTAVRQLHQVSAVSAARAVLDHLRWLAVTIEACQQGRGDDCVQNVLITLLERGPAYLKADHEAGVRALLRTCLRRCCLDSLRGPRWVSFDPDVHGGIDDGLDSSADPGDPEQEQARLGALFAEVAQAAAGRRGHLNPEAFWRALGEMQSLGSAAVTKDGLVEAELQRDDAGKGRNARGGEREGDREGAWTRIVQRHCRVRKKLREELEERRAAGGLSTEDHARLCHRVKGL
jgi:DNA-directed RNA polymerase specialized sigma24 family protein